MVLVFQTEILTLIADPNTGELREKTSTAAAEGLSQILHSHRALCEGWIISWGLWRRNHIQATNLLNYWNIFNANVIFLLFIFMVFGLFLLVGSICWSLYWDWSLLCWFFTFLFVFICVVVIRVFCLFLVFFSLWVLIGFIYLGFPDS
jgi:hypothetical protein